MIDDLTPLAFSAEIKYQATPPVYTIEREFRFEAAHRILGHPKCGRLHGHSYRVVVTLEGRDLDQQGFVIDFGDLDRVVKKVLDPLDHSYLAAGGQVYEDDLSGRFDAQILDCTTTSAENLAALFYKQIAWELLYQQGFDASRVRVSSITVYETQKNAATYKAPQPLWDLPVSSPQ